MVDYDPIIHTQEEGREFAEQNPDIFPERWAEEHQTISDLDPGSTELKKPHQHETHRTREIDKDVKGRTEICACGARRDISLTRSSPWVGGTIPITGWEKAHLEAVRRAVENSPELLDLQPNAVQDINQAMSKDPHEDTLPQDQGALAQIYGTARGAAHRLIDYHRNNSPDLG